MNFTEQEIIYVLLSGVAMIMVLIFAMKRKLSQQSEQLSEKYAQEKVASTVKKYSEANVFQYKNIFYKVGLMFSLGFAVLVVNWTTFEDSVSFETGGLVMETIETLETPIVPPVTPPPPPPPPIIEEVSDDDIEVDDVEFAPMDFDDDVIEIPIFEGKKEKIKKPTIAIDDGDDEVIEDAEFMVVENMPSFPGCDNLGTNEERKKCTEENLMKFIYKNIKYPTLAKDNGIQGMVVVSFLVDKNGKITDTKIIKEIGGGCGEEAEKVILSMNSLSERWTPGMQRARKVKVRYNMPIRFKLNN
ncbi:MAG: energy transducer TonB [Saprospiraceae bacterium]